MSHNPSKLFDRPGYIPLRDYVADIEHMRTHGPWKLPLGIGDRMQFFCLKLVARFSWYSQSLSLLHLHPWSPAYTVLLKYLHRAGFFDVLDEKSVLFPGFSAYHMKKHIGSRAKKELSSQGISRDKATALSKAIGEMIERAITGFMDTNKTVLRASPKELERSQAILYPPRFHRFLSIQQARYPRLISKSTEPLRWVAGLNFITQEKTHIPQCLTAYARQALQSAPLLQHPTSNGAAGYFTYEGAVLRGLLEVVHRDALLVHWLTQTAPEVIRPDTLPEHLRDFVEQTGTLGISLTLLNVTAIPIPSVVVVAINEHALRPGIVMSAAADASFHGALENALEEVVNLAGHLGAEFEANLEEPVADEAEPFLSKYDRISRLGYWRGKERVAEFRWFLSGERVSYADVCAGDLERGECTDHAKLAKCISILQQLGPDYFPVVYAPQHPIQEKIGFRVVQVFIPKAFPLYLTEYLGTFESDRLNEFANSKGKSQWELNPLPHMFA